MEDTSTTRVRTFRDEKRQAGYRETFLWFRHDLKHQMEEEARARRQTLAEYLVDCWRAFSPQAKRSLRQETSHQDQRLSRLEAELAGLRSLLSPERSTVPSAEPLAEEPSAKAYLNPLTGEMTTEGPGPEWKGCRNELHWAQGPCDECRKAKDARAKGRAKVKKQGTLLQDAYAIMPDTDRPLEASSEPVEPREPDLESEDLS